MTTQIKMNYADINGFLLAVGKVGIGIVVLEWLLVSRVGVEIATPLSIIIALSLYGLMWYKSTLEVAENHQDEVTHLQSEELASYREAVSKLEGYLDKALLSKQSQDAKLLQQQAEIQELRKSNQTLNYEVTSLNEAMKGVTFELKESEQVRGLQAEEITKKNEQLKDLIAKYKQSKEESATALDENQRKWKAGYYAHLLSRLSRTNDTPERKQRMDAINRELLDLPKVSEDDLWGRRS